MPDFPRNARTKWETYARHCESGVLVTESVTWRKISWRDMEPTGRQGYVWASRQEVESVFGRPLRASRLSESTFEWCLRFSDGTVANIYDHQRLNPDIGENVPIEWHVGGTSELAVVRVREALNLPD